MVKDIPWLLPQFISFPGCYREVVGVVKGLDMLVHLGHVLARALFKACTVGVSKNLVVQNSLDVGNQSLFGLPIQAPCFWEEVGAPDVVLCAEETNGLFVIFVGEVQLLFYDF